MPGARRARATQLAVPFYEDFENTGDLGKWEQHYAAVYAEYQEADTSWERIRILHSQNPFSAPLDPINLGMHYEDAQVRMKTGETPFWAYYLEAMEPIPIANRGESYAQAETGFSTDAYRALANDFAPLSPADRQEQGIIFGAGVATDAAGVFEVAAAASAARQAATNASRAASKQVFKPKDVEAYTGELYGPPHTGPTTGGTPLSQLQPTGLLPSEGAVGTYRDLIEAGTKGDNITPHHIPSATHMAQHGVSYDDGIAINMEHPHPGRGGRHRQTFTYGNHADKLLSPRDALGRGVRDTKRIYENAGLYGPDVRHALQDLIERNRQANPGLFD